MRVSREKKRRKRTCCRVRKRAHGANVCRNHGHLRSGTNDGHHAARTDRACSSPSRRDPCSCSSSASSREGSPRRDSRDGVGRSSLARASPSSCPCPFRALAPGPSHAQTRGPRPDGASHRLALRGPSESESGSSASHESGGRWWNCTQRLSAAAVERARRGRTDPARSERETDGAGWGQRKGLVRLSVLLEKLLASLMVSRGCVGRRHSFASPSSTFSSPRSSSSPSLRSVLCTSSINRMCRSVRCSCHLP